MKLALAWLTALALLGGCASVRAPEDSIAGESLSGRLTVRIDPSPTTDAHILTAAFELQGSAENGRLDLSTPLGTTLARASWSPGHVALLTPQGETRFSDLDGLTQEVLGESVPLAALFDWLRGRPWPGAASMPTTPPAEPGFIQLGWTVNLLRYAEGWISARREQAPVVTVRAKLDRP